MSDLTREEARWHEWIVRACRSVGADPAQVDVTMVHALTKDIAHGFSRPMAPVGAYILGLAVGGAGEHANPAALLTALEGTLDPAAAATPVDSAPAVRSERGGPRSGSPRRGGRAQSCTPENPARSAAGPS